MKNLYNMITEILKHKLQDTNSIYNDVILKYVPKALPRVYISLETYFDEDVFADRENMVDDIIRFSLDIWGEDVLNEISHLINKDKLETDIIYKHSVYRALFEEQEEYKKIAKKVLLECIYDLVDNESIRKNFDVHIEFKKKRTFKIDVNSLDKKELYGTVEMDCSFEDFETLLWHMYRSDDDYSSMRDRFIGRIETKFSNLEVQSLLYSFIPVLMCEINQIKKHERNEKLKLLHPFYMAKEPKGCICSHKALLNNQLVKLFVYTTF